MIIRYVVGRARMSPTYSPEGTAPRLSVVIPVFNEAHTIDEIIHRVSRAPLDLGREIVVVDDGSTDGTRERLEKLMAETPSAMRVVTHERNRGKGAAV